MTRRNVAALLASAARGAADEGPSPAPFRSPRAGSGGVKTNRRAAEAPEATYAGPGFRLVRCMPHLKRREADDAVSAGRVRVNGELVRPSRRVVSGDVVTLDGKKMHWEPYAAACDAALGDAGDAFAYLKYNKPRGVTCTMEASQRSSMMYALKDEIRALGGTRVFPVGRLDRDSSGGAAGLSRSPVSTVRRVEQPRPDETSNVRTAPSESVKSAP